MNNSGTAHKFYSDTEPFPSLIKLNRIFLKLHIAPGSGVVLAGKEATKIYTKQHGLLSERRESHLFMDRKISHLINTVRILRRDSPSPQGDRLSRTHSTPQSHAPVFPAFTAARLTVAKLWTQPGCQQQGI